MLPQLAEQRRHVLGGQQLARVGGQRPLASTSKTPPTSAAPPGPRRTRPARTLVSPTERSRPRRSASFGRRRSASTTNSRWPAEASAMARLAKVVVLPSAGIELVTTMTLRGWSMSTNCRFVRSCRNASARGDCGSSWTVSGRFGTLCVERDKAQVRRFRQLRAGARGTVTEVSRALARQAAAHAEQQTGEQAEPSETGGRGRTAPGERPRARRRAPRRPAGRRG